VRSVHKSAYEVKTKLSLFERPFVCIHCFVILDLFQRDKVFVLCKLEIDDIISEYSMEKNHSKVSQERVDEDN